MKTIIIYNEMETSLQFLILDGDYSRFNGIIVNGIFGNGFEQEFIDLMFEKDTGERNHIWSEDISILEDKKWGKVALVTWLP